MWSAMVWAMRIVPHIQSSSFEDIGQNARTTRVFKGRTHFGRSRTAVQAGRTSRHQVSAVVGKGGLGVVLQQDSGPAGPTTTVGGCRNGDSRPLAHGAGGPQRLGGAYQTGLRSGSALLSEVRYREEDHRVHRAAPDGAHRKDTPALRALGGTSSPGSTDSADVAHHDLRGSATGGPERKWARHRARWPFRCVLGRSPQLQFQVRSAPSARLGCPALVCAGPQRTACQAAQALGDMGCPSGAEC